MVVGDSLVDDGHERAAAGAEVPCLRRVDVPVEQPRDPADGLARVVQPPQLTEPWVVRHCGAGPPQPVGLRVPDRRIRLQALDRLACGTPALDGHELNALDAQRPLHPHAGVAARCGAVDTLGGAPEAHEQLSRDRVARLERRTHEVGARGERRRGAARGGLGPGRKRAHQGAEGGGERATADRALHLEATSVGETRTADQGALTFR